MAAAGSATVERVGGGGNAVAARRRQRGGSVGSVAAVGAGQWQRNGSGGGSMPAAAGLAAVMAFLWHCGVSFKKSATFMASDQESSGGHARHVCPFSDARNTFFGMLGSQLYSVATGFDSEMTMK